MSAFSSVSALPSEAVRTMAPISSRRIFSTIAWSLSRSSGSSILREMLMWLVIRAPLVPSGSLATCTMRCCPSRINPSIGGMYCSCGYRATWMSMSSAKSSSPFSSESNPIRGVATSPATRMPDSSVATRDSYGAELMTMSLFPFCTLSLPAGDELGRQLLGREPVGGKRSPQDRPRGVERPGAFPGSMDDCNEEALSVHQEIGDQGFQVDLGSAPLLLHGHREFAGGAKGLPRLLHPIRGDLLRHPAGQDREDGVAAGQVEIGDPRRPRRDLPGLPDGNPAGEEGREFFPDFGRRNGEAELRLHEFREALRADGEGMRKGQTGGGVEPLAVGNGETGPPQGAPPEGLALQSAQIPCRAVLGVPYAHDVTKNPVAAGFRVRRLRGGFPLLLTTRTGGVRDVGQAGGACAARRADARG